MAGQTYRRRSTSPADSSRDAPGEPEGPEASATGADIRESSPGGVISVRNSDVQIVLLVALMGPLAAAYISPVLPVIRDAFGLSEFQAGLLLTVYAIPGMILAPFVGMLADNIGRKRVIVTCLVVDGVAGTTIAFSGDFSQILVLRFVQGCVGGSVLFGLSMTLIGDLFDGPQVNTMMGITSAVLGLGAAVYPLFSGALASLTWRAPFIAYLASVFTAIAVWLVLDTDRLDVDGSDGGGRSIVGDLRSTVHYGTAGVVFGYSILGFVIFFGGLLTALPFFLNSDYGLTPSLTGAILTGSLSMAFVTATLNGRLARRFETNVLFLAGMICYGIGLLGVGLGTGLPQVVLSTLVFGVGHGIILPSVATVISRLGPPSARGSLMGLRTSTVLFGQAVGPGLFAVLASAIGYTSLFRVAGVISVATGAGTFVLLRGFKGAGT